MVYSLKARNSGLPHLSCLYTFLPLHFTPYTLHFTPYTLHSTPYTLHPTPYTIQRLRLSQPLFFLLPASNLSQPILASWFSINNRLSANYPARVSECTKKVSILKIFWQNIGKWHFFAKKAQNLLYIQKKVVPLHSNLRWREVSLRKKGWI